MSNTNLLNKLEQTDRVDLISIILHFLTEEQKEQLLKDLDEFER
jgi:hypothetical protein